MTTSRWTSAPRSQAYPDCRTDTFTPATIPAGLRRSHSTAAGVWDLIHVLQGHLAYRITDPRHTPVETVLSPSEPPGVIRPGVTHEVEPLDDVRFYVEFHRAASGD